MKVDEIGLELESGQSKKYNKELGLYIHIPFCKAKCYYCDFNSYARMENHTEPYFEAMKREIELYSEKLHDWSIKTVFIGGGTPSSVDVHYIYEVMNLCRRRFNIQESAEISIETNPGTLSYEKLTSYKVLGINRLSIGLQAWQDRLLKGLGRIHSNADFVENFHQARKAGFKNINTDLIFGLPGQTLKDWKDTLTNVVNLGPEHLSCYSLKIEEGTVFGSRVEAEELIPVEDELDREMYHATIELLSGSGYKHYELSNFSRPGFECRHNMVYWKAEPYIGIGAGAHSFFEKKRYNNIYNINEYINTALDIGIPSENSVLINEKDDISEFLILGLRLIDGIGFNEFKSRFGKDLSNIYSVEIQKLVNKGLLQVGNGRMKLTALGLDIANEVFVEFV